MLRLENSHFVISTTRAARHNLPSNSIPLLTLLIPYEWQDTAKDYEKKIMHALTPQEREQLLQERKKFINKCKSEFLPMIQRNHPEVFI